MNSTERTTLWDTLQNYQRRSEDSINPPSERINPDIQGSHFWVIVATNWHSLHPLVQDVLYVWYKELSKLHGGEHEELDPQSTEALVKRFDELDSKVRAFDLERSNLETELTIRDRDFQRLRSLSGKKEKENIEVQQMLGKSFQEKIMMKQDELDEKEDKIRELLAQVNILKQNKNDIPRPTAATADNGSRIVIPENMTQSEVIQNLKRHIDERSRLLKQVNDKLKELNAQVHLQKETITNLESEVRLRDEKIKEIKGLLQL